MGRYEVVKHTKILKVCLYYLLYITYFIPVMAKSVALFSFI